MNGESHFTYNEETNQGRLFYTLERCCEDMLSDILEYESQDYKEKMTEEEVKPLAMQHFIRAIEGLKGDLQNAPRR